MIIRFAPISRLRLVALIGLSLAISACGTPPPRADSEGREAHTMSLAMAARSAIEAPSARTTAAAEIVQALAATNRSTDASQLLDASLSEASAIDDPIKRASGLVELASAAARSNQYDWLRRHHAQIERQITTLDKPDKRQDLTGKLLVATAAYAEPTSVVDAALALHEGDATLDSYKARTLGEIAQAMESRGHTEQTDRALAAITMGIPYYEAVARIRVANEAHARSNASRSAQWLDASEPLVGALTDGYFRAGALRQLASAYQQRGESGRASGLYQRALSAAREAKSAQHKARAISRIATSMADHQRYADARATLDEAINIISSEPNEDLRLWSLYEIAGSAAFAGDFERARQLIDQIPRDKQFFGASLAPATERDLAFGLAKHDRFLEAVTTANAIRHPRERAQALARIVRVMADPALHALPRYL